MEDTMKTMNTMNTMNTNATANLNTIASAALADMLAGMSSEQLASLTKQADPIATKTTGQKPANNTKQQEKTADTVVSADYKAALAKYDNFAKVPTKDEDLKPILKQAEKCYRAFCLWQENLNKGNDIKAKKYRRELADQFKTLQGLAGECASQSTYEEFLTMFGVRYTKIRGKEEYTKKPVAMAYFKKSVLDWHKGGATVVKEYKERKAKKPGKATKNTKKQAAK